MDQGYYGLVKKVQDTIRVEEFREAIFELSTLNAGNSEVLTSNAGFRHVLSSNEVHVEVLEIDDEQKPIKIEASQKLQKCSLCGRIRDNMVTCESGEGS